MILASLLLPIAVAAIVFLVQKVRLPVFLAVMATVVVYGIAADMTFQSVGKAFDKLREQSQHENVKLRDIAREIVERANRRNGV